MFKLYLKNLFGMVVILFFAFLVGWFLSGVLPVQWIVLLFAGLLLLVLIPGGLAEQDRGFTALRKELGETVEAYHAEKRRAEDAEAFIKSFVRPEHVTANLDILHKAYLDAVEDYRAAVVRRGDSFSLGGLPESVAPQAILKFRNELYELEGKIGSARNDLTRAGELSKKMGFASENIAAGKVK